MKDKASRVLVVDDESDIRELLTITLERMGLVSLEAATVAQAKSVLLDNTVDLCLTDMRLPDGNGIELVKFMQTEFAHVPVAVITAHGNVETAVEALKAGAFDFVSKPLDLGDLRALITAALRTVGTTAPSTVRNRTLIGSSPAIVAMREQIGRVARSSSTGLHQRRIWHRERTRGPYDSRPRRSVGRALRTGQLRRDFTRSHRE